MYYKAPTFEDFMMRWEFANMVRAAHGLPEILYGEARAIWKRP